MNEYNLVCGKDRLHPTYVQWFGDSLAQVRKEAEDCGHWVRKVQFVRVVEGGDATRKSSDQ